MKNCDFNLVKLEKKIILENKLKIINLIIMTVTCWVIPDVHC